MIPRPRPIRKRAYQARKTAEEKEAYQKAKEEEKRNRLRRFLTSVSAPDVTIRSNDGHIPTTSTSNPPPAGEVDGDRRCHQDDDEEGDDDGSDRDDEDDQVDAFTAGLVDEYDHELNTDDEDIEEVLLDDEYPERLDLLQDLMDGSMASQNGPRGVQEPSLPSSSYIQQDQPGSIQSPLRDFSHQSAEGFPQTSEIPSPSGVPLDTYSLPDYNFLFLLVTAFQDDKNTPSGLQQFLNEMPADVEENEDEIDVDCDPFISLPAPFVLKISLLCKIMGITRVNYKALQTVINSLPLGPEYKLPKSLTGLHSWQKFLPKSQVIAEEVWPLDIQFLTTNHVLDSYRRIRPRRAS